MTANEAIERIDAVLSSDYHYDETIGYQLTSDDFDWLERARESLCREMEAQQDYRENNLVFERIL